MSKDGPPSSGGYRYGSLKAFRANLPAKAINPRGIITEVDYKARKNLSDFAAYPARARSIGKQLPVTRGISPSRAAVIQRTAELEQKDTVVKSVTLSKSKRYWLKLVFGGASKSFRFFEEDLLLGTNRYSLPYGSRDQALIYYRTNTIRWYPWRSAEFRSGP